MARAIPARRRVGKGRPKLSSHLDRHCHEARAEIYHANLMRHYKDPKVLGVTYCACMFDQGGNTLLKGNQNGFFSLEGEPRTKLIEAVTAFNGQWVQQTAKPGDEATLNALDAKLWETWDRHQVKPHRDATDTCPFRARPGHL